MYSNIEFFCDKQVDKVGMTLHDICFDLIVKNATEHNTEAADSLM